jgi:hypothetical protein
MREQPPRVVYLHGFNSSPASHKARLVVEYCNANQIACAVPALSHDPVLAMKTAQSCVMEQGGAAILLIGSSLGGYYATWLAEKFKLKAALVNPAVSPCDHVNAEFLGHHHNYYSGEEYEFTPQHVEALRMFDVRIITDPKRYLLLVQTGDEVLDYRLAVERYAGCEQIVQQCGNHSFENFAALLPLIMKFAGQK